MMLALAESQVKVIGFESLPRLCASSQWHRETRATPSRRGATVPMRRDADLFSPPAEWKLHEIALLLPPRHQESLKSNSESS